MKSKTSKKASVLIAVILTALIPLGLYSNWIQNSIKNQDSFITAFSLNEENTKVKKLLVDSTFQYIDALELKEIIDESLPAALTPLSAQIELSAKRALKILAQELFNSNNFELLWNQLLASIHLEFTKVIIEDSQGYFHVYANELYVTSAPIKDRLISNLSNDLTWQNLIEELDALDPPKIRILDAEQLNFVRISWQLISLLNQYLWLVLFAFVLLLVALEKSLLNSFKYLGFSMFLGGSFTILSTYLLANFLNTRLTTNLAEEMLAIFFTSSAKELISNSYFTILIGFMVLLLYFSKYLRAKFKAIHN